MSCRSSLRVNNSDMLVDQLLKLLREGPHGAVLDGGAAMVTPEAMLSY